MARIRSIKPELASKKKMASLSIQARYTLVLLITQVDDEGYLAASDRQLLGSLYPFDTAITIVHLREWLFELEAANSIKFHETEDGASVVQVVGWQEHQRVKNPTPSKIYPLLSKVSVGVTESLRKVSVLEVGSRKKEVGSRKKEIGTVVRPDVGDGHAGSESYPPDFDAAWVAYPARSGGNPKKAAYRGYAARRKAGVSAADLLAGTERYAAFVVASGTDPRFVKQAATFFGADEWYAEPWEVKTAVSAEPTETRLERLHRLATERGLENFA